MWPLKLWVFYNIRKAGPTLGPSGYHLISNWNVVTNKGDDANLVFLEMGFLFKVR